VKIAPERQTAKLIVNQQPKPATESPEEERVPVGVSD
jgi:hypothetical protein